MNSASLVAFGVVLTFALISPGADRAPKSQQPSTVRYAATNGRLRIEGRSSIHDFNVEGRQILGFMDVPVGFPEQPSPLSKSFEDRVIAEVSMPVRSLRSVGNDGAAYSDKFDEIMYEKLGERTQPAIQFQLQKLVWISAETNSQHFKLTGRLAVGGYTNTVECPVTITRLPGTKLRASGEVPIRTTDFGIPPPVGTSRLTVKVLFDWTVERPKVR
ncbi:MAG TPA: YceI family protein [Clostridia bacterium]|nr:YceI family protein [Clostridia bacterium]